ncbi:uncharacterized protein BXZ73DRAFT_105027 [Epithele typhae]|uniref:uncharacterized protein n=1 Tax=Epithele typhae TaxID=378194 RepID=UPI0020077D47|nr:uncharacterized protein BXZ73DRAFT_105027 [Epithele typhae]KAH9919201.1 hypothetical protein BXZ73DRAFT_105027 [Epithele typhae]
MPPYNSSIFKQIIDSVFIHVNPVAGYRTAGGWPVGKLGCGPEYVTMLLFAFWPLLKLKHDRRSELHTPALYPSAIMDRILAEIHQTILCIEAPMEVQRYIDHFRCAPDFLIPPFQEVNIYFLTPDADAPTDDIHKLNQLLRLLARLPTIQKLTMRLPRNTSDNTLTGFVFSHLRRLEYYGPRTAIRGFLSMHLDRINVLAFDGIFAPPRTRFEFTSMVNLRRLTCPVAYLHGVSFPLFEVHTLKLELDEGSTSMSDSIQTISPSIFPALDCLFLQVGPDDQSLLTEVSSRFPDLLALLLADGSKVWEEYFDRTAPRPWSDLFTETPLITAPIGHIGAEHALLLEWSGLAVGDLHPSLETAVVAYASDFGVAAEVLSTWAIDDQDVARTEFIAGQGVVEQKVFQLHCEIIG